MTKSTLFIPLLLLLAFDISLPAWGLPGDPPDIENARLTTTSADQRYIYLFDFDFVNTLQQAIEIISVNVFDLNGQRVEQDWQASGRNWDVRLLTHALSGNNPLVNIFSKPRGIPLEQASVSTVGDGIAIKVTNRLIPSGARISPGIYILSSQSKYDSLILRVTYSANGDQHEVNRTFIAGCPSPRVYFSNISGPVGSTITITGTGWVPGSTVKLTLPYGSKAQFGVSSHTPQVTTTGDWDVALTVGKNTPVGQYVMNFDETTPGCSLSLHPTFTVFGKPPTSARLPVPFATQMGTAGDPNTGGDNCGPASITMAIRYYGGSTTVQDIAIAIRGSNDSLNGTTDFKSQKAIGTLEKYLLTEKSVNNIEQMRTEIASERPVIILVNNEQYRHITPVPYSSDDHDWFTRGHIIVVTGYDSDNVYVNDPLRNAADYPIPLEIFKSAASTAYGTSQNDWYAASVLRK